MKTSIKLFRIILCILSITALFLPLAGCAEKQQEIDWTMHGTWVTSSGEVLDEEPIEFTITGKLPVEIELYDAEVTEFDCTFPDTFPYMYSGGEMSCHKVPSEDGSTLYYWLNGGAYDPAANLPIRFTFTICPETGRAYFEWGSDDRYLVASTDPNADPAEILEYFSEMLVE